MGKGRNMSIMHKKTGTVHYGTVDTETGKIVSVLCGKTSYENYEPCNATITCLVCKTKLTGMSHYRTSKRY